MIIDTSKITSQEEAVRTFRKLANQLMTKFGALEMAPVFILHGMRAYKTTMTETDYNLMVDVISDRRNLIEPFDNIGDNK